MSAPAISEREMALHQARVFLREARARRSTPFAAVLLQWAANARRRARDARAAERVAAKPAQLDLFGG